MLLTCEQINSPVYCCTVSSGPNSSPEMQHEEHALLAAANRSPGRVMNANRRLRSAAVDGRKLRMRGEGVFMQALGFTLLPAELTESCEL